MNLLTIEKSSKYFFQQDNSYLRAYEAARSCQKRILKILDVFFIKISFDNQEVNLEHLSNFVLTLITTKTSICRAVGRFDNLEGGSSNVVGIICPLLEIGLTCLSKSMGVMFPTTHSAPTALIWLREI